MKKEMGDNARRAWPFSLSSAHTFLFPDAFCKKKFKNPLQLVGCQLLKPKTVKLKNTEMNLSFPLFTYPIL